jgi:tetratricopeptide (TPR) repeat protein
LAEWYRSRVSTWDARGGAFRFDKELQKADSSVGLEAVRHFLAAGERQQASTALVGVAEIVARNGEASKFPDLIARVSPSGEAPVPWLQIYAHDLVLNGNQPGDKQLAVDGLQTIAESDHSKVASAALICLAKDDIRKLRFESARARLERSKELKLGMMPADTRGVAYILNELGHIATKEGGSSARSIEYHQAALSMARATDDARAIAYTLRRIASIELHRHNQPAKALTLLEEAQKNCERVGANVILIDVLAERGEAVRRMGDYAEAGELLKTALRLAEQAKEPFAEGRIQKRLGVLYEKSEQFRPALEAYEKASKIFNALGSDNEREAVTAVARIRARMAELERQVALLESEVSAQDPAQARITRRQIRRLNQKLGLEPAPIRTHRRVDGSNNETP